MSAVALLRIHLRESQEEGSLCSQREPGFRCHSCTHAGSFLVIADVAWVPPKAKAGPSRVVLFRVNNVFRAILIPKLEIGCPPFLHSFLIYAFS